MQVLLPDFFHSISEEICSVSLASMDRLEQEVPSMQIWIFVLNKTCTCLEALLL
jgi:hypothetical protein